MPSPPESFQTPKAALPDFAAEQQIERAAHERMIAA